jgi:hypothetical protein
MSLNPQDITGTNETGFQKIMNGLLRGEIATKKAKS